MATGADCMVSGAQDGVGRVRHRANAGSRPARLPECSRSTSSRTSPPSTPSPNRSGSRTGSSPPSPCEAEAPRLRNLSDFVLREVGCHWVAEGAAPAAATALERELTLPGVSQTVILTRTSTRSSPMPEGEELAALARSGATLAIHLSIRSIGAVCEALAPAYGADCPAAVVHRASWPDERIVSGTLADLAAKVRPLRLRRTALILVGRVLAAEAFDDSALYDAAHHHLLRPRKKKRQAG